MKSILLFTFLGLHWSSYAQKHDFIWTFGYAANYIDTVIENGGCIIDFKYNPPKMTKLNTVLNFGRYAATCSDSSGYLQFYTNGMHIFNKNYQMMENGDTINPGENWNIFNETNYGYIGRSPIALPDPGGQNKYYLIHTGVYIDTSIKYGPLYYTEIDMNQNNGDGKVVTKNNLLHEGGFSEPAAVKHANGRDWWVFLQIVGQPVILRYLIDPNGVTFSGEQTLPLTIPFDSDVTRCRISPDGNRFALINNFIALYDFDRCSGLLSNQRTLNFDASFYFNYLSFSPDSRFLYTSTSRTVTQFDLLADTIQSSGLDTIQKFDYTNYPFPPFYAGFADPVIAPDGKIYYLSSGTTPYMSPMHRPNLPGSSCDFEVAGLRLPRFNDRSFYNFPNYRLGAMEGSSCDTIVYKKRPGFEHTTYEALLEQQSLSRRQVFRQVTPATGQRPFPSEPEMQEYLMLEEVKKMKVNKMKSIDHDEK